MNIRVNVYVLQSAFSLALATLLQLNALCQVKIQKPDLVLPSRIEITSDSMEHLKNALHILVLNKDFATAYWNGKDSIKSYFLQPLLNWRDFIKARKEEYGDSLIIILKVSSQVSYSQTIEIVDGLTINKIAGFALADLTQEDVLRFMSNVKPPSPIEITTPVSVTTESVSMYRNSLVFNFVSTSVVNIKYYDTLEIEKVNVNKSKESDIRNVIAKTVGLAGGIKNLTVFIISDSDQKYTAFEKIINALRANEIYSFKLVSTRDNNGLQKN